MEVLRSKPYASVFFGADGDITAGMGGLPRYKFMYYARFVPSSEAQKLYNDLKDLGRWENGISFKIRSIDKPNIDLNIQQLNQYNRKRYAYTKVEYKPIKVKVYDTSNDIPLELWRRYFTYYFGDSRNKGQSASQSTANYNQPPVTGTFNYGNGWGFSPISERLNFFDRIELYAIFGRRYTQINYINPKISDVNWGTYESDSSELADFDMTLNYEAIEYLPPGQFITPTMASQLGFDIEPPAEIPGISAPLIDIDSWIPRTDIYGLVDSLVSRLNRALPSDFSNGLGTTFQIANAALNIFSRGSIVPGAYPDYTYGTANQIASGVTAYNSLSALLNGQQVVNPAAPSSFLGSSAYGFTSLPPSGTSVLDQYGGFSFGSSFPEAEDWM
jgi:hypothetical protein